MEKSDYKKGVMYIIFSAFCFAFMNLFIRLSGDVPTLQKCFFRNLFAMIIAVSSLIRSGTSFRIGKGNTKYLVLRSVSGGLGMICNFYAVDHMAISDASMLNKLSPFFATLFCIFIMKEKADKYEWAALIIAFIGSLFVVKPTFDAETIPALAGFTGGLGAGLAYAFVRKLGTRGENSMIVVAFFSCFTSVMLLPFVIASYKPMTGKQWILLVLTGLAAAGGQIGITRAYSNAPAAHISVYDFSIVIFAAVLGFAFLGQIPDVLSVIGYIIIIGTAVAKWYFTAVKHKNTRIGNL